MAANLKVSWLCDVTQIGMSRSPPWSTDKKQIMDSDWVDFVEDNDNNRMAKISPLGENRIKSRFNLHICDYEEKKIPDRIFNAVCHQGIARNLCLLL